MALQPREMAIVSLNLDSFELGDSGRPLIINQEPKAVGSRQRRSRPPFASVSMQHSSPQPRRAQPAFMVASATESAALDLEGVPQWRIAAGNLAAGATAGCAVEAGASSTSCCCPPNPAGLNSAPPPRELSHHVVNPFACSPVPD